MTNKPLSGISVAMAGNSSRLALMAALSSMGAVVQEAEAEAKPEPLRVPILRDLGEKPGPWWGSTGKQTAQWKDETRGRKRK